MHTQYGFVFAVCCLTLLPQTARSQAPDAESLTLDSAVSAALGANRELRSAHISVLKVDDQIAAARTRRLPQLSWYTLAVQRLTTLNFTFDRGAFGEFPSIGPVPAENTRIQAPRQPAALLLGQLVQPLSDQFKISLNLRQLETQREIATEAEREKKAGLVSEVKKAYYAIVQAQSALQSVEESIRLYRESDRLTEQFVLQQVALKADNLDIKARLAKAEYDALAIRNPLESQKERLNLLLGRDLRTPFSVVDMADANFTSQELPELQRLALERRPELRQARLRSKQAELDRRIARTDYIPTVAFNVSYLSPLNYGSLIPANIASAGVMLQWEPFDWGRRRHQISEKTKTIDQAALAVRETQDQILLDVNARFRKVQETRQLLTVARLTRDVAQERLRVANNRYGQNVALLKDVLQHQASLAEANYQFSQSLAAFWTASAELEKAVGEQ